MSKYRHLSRAPITEAVFHFMVTPSPTLTIERLESATPRLRATHPKSAPLFEVSAKVTFAPSKDPSVTQRRAQDGFRFASPDEKEITSFAKSWFAYSRLAPYTSWAEVFPRVIAAWEIYNSVSAPAQIVRVAVRYINRLVLPLVDNLGDYLSTDPSVPAGLPISGWFTRMNVIDKEFETAAVVMQAMEVLPTTQISLMLDNDVFSTQPIDPFDHAALAEVLLRLHEAKNKLFFESLTERALEAVA